jgi:PAS domain S-box-containing protein
VEEAFTDAIIDAMAEAAPVMIWLSEPDRICTYFNRVWLEFTGRTLEQELAHDWVEDVHPEDRAHCLTVYTTAFEAQASFRVEYRLRRHDGVYRWILDSGRPRYLPDGGFAGYISAGLDITERKEAKLRLARAYEELEQRVAERTADLAQANAELRQLSNAELLQLSTELARSNADLEQFAYVASHDLQEPLRAVVGCVQLLQQRYQGQLDARADQYIRHAVEGAKRMQRLINDLLTYSRITTQARALTPTDSGAVLQAVLQSLAPALEGSGAVVNTGALPAVMVDPTQLTQLFQNLVSE